MNEHYQKAEANMNAAITHLKLFLSSHDPGNYHIGIDSAIDKLVAAKGFVEVGKYADAIKSAYET